MHQFTNSFSFCQMIKTMPEQYFTNGENPALNCLYQDEIQLNVYRNKSNNCLNIKGLVIDLYAGCLFKECFMNNRHKNGSNSMAAIAAVNSLNFVTLPQ
jgi:hypothetical protein